MKNKNKRKPTLVTKFMLDGRLYEIHANQHGYILRVLYPDTLKNADHPSYFWHIDTLLEDLFECVSRKRLGTGRVKSMETIIDIVKKARVDVEKILEPLKKL